MHGFFWTNVSWISCFLQLAKWKTLLTSFKKKKYYKCIKCRPKWHIDIADFQATNQKKEIAPHLYLCQHKGQISYWDHSKSSSPHDGDPPHLAPLQGSWWPNGCFVPGLYCLLSRLKGRPWSGSTPCLPGCCAACLGVKLVPHSNSSSFTVVWLRPEVLCVTEKESAEQLLARTQHSFLV